MYQSYVRLPQKQIPQNAFDFNALTYPYPHVATKMIPSETQQEQAKSFCLNIIRTNN